MAHQPFGSGDDFSILRPSRNAFGVERALHSTANLAIFPCQEASIAASKRWFPPLSGWSSTKRKASGNSATLPFRSWSIMSVCVGIFLIFSIFLIKKIYYFRKIYKLNFTFSIFLITYFPNDPFRQFLKTPGPNRLLIVFVLQLLNLKMRPTIFDTN